MTASGSEHASIQHEHDTAVTATFRAARDQLLRIGQEGIEAGRDFTWPDLGDDFNWAHDWFDPIATGNTNPALRLIEDDGTEATYTFDELRERSNQVAHWLLEQGVGPGETVMLMLANRVELWEAMLALLKIGAVILPTAIVLGPGELDDRVERARVKWVITDEADSEKFDGVDGDFQVIATSGARGAEQVALSFANAPDDDRNRPRIPYEDARGASTAPVERTAGGHDPAIIYFSSGTTSRPKIVVHTHLSYPAGHLSTMAWIGVQPGERHMVISSPGWGKHAWSAFFGPWNAEATVVMDNTARFDPRALVERLDAAEIQTFCAPPTVWRMVIKAGRTERPRALRSVISAGEPLNPEVIDRIREWWGLEIRDGYGQTETTAIVGNLAGDGEVVAGSMGRPMPGVHVVLVDQQTGERLPDGVPCEGEICLDLAPGRPFNLMQSYFEDPDATAGRFEGGVFHTGDVATRDADGRYTFVGRTDDVFKASDYKVSPFEVESALVQHAAVAEAAVVGAPDPTRMNITKAYVALAEGHAADADTAFAILRHARHALPPYMRVRRIEFSELPKTISGKIRRVELRQREQEWADRGERIESEWREEDFPDLKRS